MTDRHACSVQHNLLLSVHPLLQTADKINSWKLHCILSTCGHHHTKRDDLDGRLATQCVLGLPGMICEGKLIGQVGKHHHVINVPCHHGIKAGVGDVIPGGQSRGTHMNQQALLHLQQIKQQ
jgi:hypothetical protein